MFVLIGFFVAAPLGLWQGIMLFSHQWKNAKSLDDNDRKLLRDIPFRCSMHVLATAVFMVFGFIIDNDFTNCESIVISS